MARKTDQPPRCQPEPKLQSIGGGFLIPRTDVGRSSDRFASPKPKQPELDRSYIKNLAKSGKIKPNPTNSQQFLEKFVDSDEKMQIPAKKNRFQQHFCKFWRPTEPTDAHPYPKPTWSIDAGGRFRVPSRSTQRWWVKSDLGPKSTHGQA